MVMLCLLKNLLILLKADVAFAIRVLISYDLSQFSLIIVPKYVVCCTLSIIWLLIFFYFLFVITNQHTFCFGDVNVESVLATFVMLSTKAWSPLILSDVQITSIYEKPFHLFYNFFEKILSSSLSDTSLYFYSFGLFFVYSDYRSLIISKGYILWMVRSLSSISHVLKFFDSFSYRTLSKAFWLFIRRAYT